MKTIIIVISLVLSVFYCKLASSAETYAGALEGAVAEPNNDAAFELLLSKLPKVHAGFLPDQEYFVFDGDEALSEDGVRGRLLQMHARTLDKKACAGNESAKCSYSSELIVNMFNGKPDYLMAPSERILKFAIWRKSFRTTAEFDVARHNLARATADWESSCPKCEIKFVHEARHDSKNEGEINQLLKSKDISFVVVKRPLGGALAMAFFPNEPWYRHVLFVDPSFFSQSLTISRAGIIRHEIGHILGYRHEHTRSPGVITGCGYEDNSWKALTRYDSKSVMHYLCGGAGDSRLRITPLDKRGHQLLYLGPEASDQGQSQ